MGKVTHDEAAVNAVRKKMNNLRTRIELLEREWTDAGEYLDFLLQRQAAEKRAAEEK